MFGLFGGFFSGEAVIEDTKTYTVSADIHSLKIKINAADFTIKQGERFFVESNLKHLTVEDKNGVLTIKETKIFSGTYTGAVLTLYIPADTVFEKVNIITGDIKDASKIFGASSFHVITTKEPRVKESPGVLIVCFVFV